MKTCLSDFEKYRYITDNCKLCPYSCCSCYIIECCCCCHCSCHIKKQRKINSPNALTYSLMTTTTDYYTQNKIIPIEDYNKKSNNINIYKNENENPSKKVIYKRKNSSNMINNNNKNVLFLRNDLINQTKNIKNEIKELKSKLKNEKENIAKILKTDFNIIKDRINMKKNENNKKVDNNKKINYNIIMEKPREMKKIYLPKKIDNFLRSNSNKKLKNEIISHYLSHRSNNNNNTNKNIDFFNNKINEDDINRDRDYLKSDYNFKGLNKITNHINQKIPFLYCKDRKLKINSYNSSSSCYPANQTETSSLNFKQKYSPTKLDNNNILKLYSHISHIHKNKRNNRIGSCNYSFSTYHPNNSNLNYDNNSEYNSFLYKGTNIRTHRMETDSFDNFSCNNYTLKSKIHERQLYNPVVSFNNDNKVPKLFFNKNRRFHYSNSYGNKNDININRSFPLNKYEHSFLSHKKYQSNLIPLQRKNYFYNKYNSDINKYRRNINNMRIKNSPHLLLNGNNTNRKIVIYSNLDQMKIFIRKIIII